MSSEVTDITSPFQSPTFGKDGSFEVNKPVGSMSISPCGRDVVLASRHGLHIVDLDSPWSPPRHLAHHTPWEVADVQWSPFPSRDHWVVSTSNQKALVWNLEMPSRYNAVELVIHGHSRALTDIQFSAHHPDMLATCSVDSFVHCWDLRQPTRPAISFCDWFAGATQTKWNRRNSHIIASSHDRTLHIWDDRKGATPLRSLDAHDTKIYGIDWSRTDQNKIITCSLDKSIKFWDYSTEGNRPERLLRTPFPVWRARHTPFGHGIMAMPQRGDFDVYLYDCREESIWDRDPDRAPVFVEKFTGHQNNVKEFLWRPRGSSEELADNREFQLVTWGSDHYLRLHHLDDRLLEKTGFSRGKPGHRTTRRGAIYKTFRVDDEDLPSIPPQLGPLLAASNHSGRGPAAMTPGPAAGALGWADMGFVSTQHGTPTMANGRKDIDPITWMKGVKIGKRDDRSKQDVVAVSMPTLNVEHWDHYDNLGEEVSHVGQTFSKVEFQTVDINKRFIRMSLSGPWGKDRLQAYLTCRMQYPIEYPSQPAIITIQETTSIAPDKVSEMAKASQSISRAFSQHKKHSTEAIIHYLQGEKTLDDLTGLLKQGLETPDILPVANTGDSSSEDEDELDPLSTAQLDELGLGGSDVLASSNPNANVPLPKACGAIWTNDGRLLCFFPPKADPLASATAAYGLDGTSGTTRRKSRFFDGFGRFHSLVETRQSRASSLGTFESSPPSSDSEEESSVTSSSDSSMPDGPLSENIQSASQHMMSTNPLTPGIAFRPIEGFQGSQTSRRLDEGFWPTPKNVISIHDFRHLLPAQRSLAECHYDSPDAASFNAELTAKLGFTDLASAWQLVRNLLMAQGHTTNLISTTTSRRLSMRRPDRGQRTLSFRSKTPTHKMSTLNNSTFLDNVGTTAAKDVFEYFCARGDIQTAATLSCVLRHILPSYVPAFGVVDSQPDLKSPVKAITGRPPILRHDSLAVEDELDEGASSPGKRQPASYEAGSGDDLIVNPPSLASSLGADLSDQPRSSSTGNVTSSNRASKAVTVRKQDSFLGLKPSPSRIWQFENATGLLARASNFASDISRLSLSASASPPSRKHSSPSLSLNTANSMRHSRGNLPAPDADHTYRESGFQDDYSEESSVKQTTSKRDDRRKRTFKVSYRAEKRLSNQQTILSPTDQQQLRWLMHAYRSAYAEMLSMWQLPILRAEVVKHNVSPTATPVASGTTLQDRTKLEAAQAKRPLELGKRPRASSGEAEPVKPGVRAWRVCHSCSIPQWSLLGQGRTAAPFRCAHCHVRARALTCVLCNRMVRGKAFPCATCGHLLHSRCRAKVAQDPALQGLCPGGCDCRCASKVVVEVKTAKRPDPAKLVKKQSSVDTLATEVRVDSLGGRSPVIGHVTERGRHASVHDGEGVDLRSVGFAWARESLARNLELRRTRARSVDRRVDRDAEQAHVPGRKLLGMTSLSEWG